MKSVSTKKLKQLPNPIPSTVMCAFFVNPLSVNLLATWQCSGIIQKVFQSVYKDRVYGRNWPITCRSHTQLAGVRQYTPRTNFPIVSVFQKIGVYSLRVVSISGRVLFYRNSSKLKMSIFWFKNSIQGACLTCIQGHGVLRRMLHEWSSIYKSIEDCRVGRYCYHPTYQYKNKTYNCNHLKGVALEQFRIRYSDKWAIS